MKPTHDELLALVQNYFPPALDYYGLDVKWINERQALIESYGYPLLFARTLAISEAFEANISDLPSAKFLRDWLSTDDGKEWMNNE